ncbi:MAG: hypothetical protein ABJB85_08015 [Nitrososphaerota archaeon]
MVVQPEFQIPAYAQLILSIVYRADAGGGNATIPLNFFHPKNITIDQSTNIKWQNPTLGIQYPHTVTFIRADSNLTIPKINFNLSNYSSLIDSKYQNAQNDKAAAVNVNPEILPTVISANGTITNLDPYGNLGGDGAQYNFTGTEKYVNSGFIWPEGHVPKGFANITSFTVKFEKQGVYHFQCLIHPEMTGNVTVTPPNTPMGMSHK